MNQACINAVTAVNKFSKLTHLRIKIAFANLISGVIICTRDSADTETERNY